ncbi:MAG: hypothetical protein SNJ56_03200, partial [Termitinemataceae bacterium]
MIFEQFRESLYTKGYSGKTIAVKRKELLQGLTTFQAHIRYTIGKNRRDDGLYHAYNTFSLDKDGGVQIHYLDEMLEGQVAVLSSRALSGTEALGVFKALRSSRMFREDQYSYMLYPEKELPHFLQKNCVQRKDVESIPLLQRMLENGDPRIIKIDSHGIAHFNGAFRNAKDLEAVLHVLQAQASQAQTSQQGNSDLAALAKQDAPAVLDLYERTFNHRSFTGRSGSFYAYEGLGSIYWHMVSKLLLAIQENVLWEQDPPVRQELIAAYYDVRKGLGFNKTPDVYGAFPTDPYSHTPAGQGAKQPGMTGQVKEEVLTRWGELGIKIENGCLHFNPMLLKREEFFEDRSLEFTYCGIPVRYERTNTNTGSIHVYQAGSGGVETLIQDGLVLNESLSRRVFMRDAGIQRILVKLPQTINLQQ